MPFVLHPKLESDSAFVCDLALSQVRLSHNAAFPWLILIPRKPNLIDIIDLPFEQESILYQEIRHASLILKKLFLPTKLNVANLGNVVSQLHIHVIARFEQDLAWPNPVWNSGISALYTEKEQSERIVELHRALKECVSK
jgi:diadenosine tetraphosphate (Ap4A) HIT family hydrolase